MSPDLFFKGLGVGLAVAAPVAPIGVLCIQRTLIWGRMVGFVSGLGVATADALLASVAAFGLTFVTGFINDYREWLRLGGGLFLIIFGLVLFFLLRPPETSPDKENGSRGLGGAYLSMFIITVANPMTIISFAAIFAAIGYHGTHGEYGHAGSLVAGVFFGSTLWWLILTYGMGLLRSRVTPGAIRWINRISALFFIAFGVAFILIAARNPFLP